MDLRVTKEDLRAVMPHARTADIERFHCPLLLYTFRYHITTPLRVAHFLAQIGHESGSLRYTEEIASGEAYEGREDLGNTEPGDGKLFKGRGLIQLTGRANYKQYSKHTGTDYVANPSLLSTDSFAAMAVSCWFWQSRGLNGWADLDDIEAITRRVNGGLNGLDKRMKLLERAKLVFVQERDVEPASNNPEQTDC